MKTKLTGADLMFIADVMKEQLKVCNYTDKHKERCASIHNTIAESLDKIKIEIKTPKKK